MASSQRKTLLFFCSICLLLIGSMLFPACQHTSQRARSPHVRLLDVPPRLYKQVRWSPDGTMLAAIGARRGSGQIPHSLLLLRPDGSLISEITTFPGTPANLQIHAVAWRPDGMLTVAVDQTAAADVRQDPLPDREALFLLDPDVPAQPPQLLRANLARIDAMDWSPDGAYLLLTQPFGPPLSITTKSHRQKGLMVYARSNDTLTEWLYHDSALIWPRWHPAGHALLYIAIAEPLTFAATAQYDLVMRPWTDDTRQRISFAPACDILEAAWSPDGQWMVYREVCQHVQDARIDHLVVIPVAHPDQRTEVCDGQALRVPDWGPDQQIVATTIGTLNRNNLVLCTVDLNADE